MEREPLDTFKQGDRFSYEGINLDYLRSLPQLPEWLKQNKRKYAVMRWRPNGSRDFPPGHPGNLLYTPENWTGTIKGVQVIPDPENYAWGEVDYKKEDGYVPKENEYHPGVHTNRYYVVFPSDYKKLWNHLPWNHLRMRLWEIDLYQYNHTSYTGHNGETFFYPANWQLKVYPPKIDEHWKEEYKEQVLRNYEMDKAAELAEQKQYASKWATPENNLAVKAIRKFYPDYQPRLDLIKDPKSSTAYNLLEPDRWYRLYASLEAMENDHIKNIGKKRV